MSGKYTNKTLPNDPEIFPQPATWMSWVRDFGRRQVKRDSNGEYVKVFDASGRHIGYEYEDFARLEEGKVRHHYTRAETRKSLMWLGKNSKYLPEDQRGRFVNDWAVYEWVDGEWVLRGQGFKGELRKDNPFFKAKPTKEELVHPFDKVQQDRAIESILKAAG